MAAVSGFNDEKCPLARYCVRRTYKTRTILREAVHSCFPRTQESHQFLREDFRNGDCQVLERIDRVTTLGAFALTSSPQLHAVVCRQMEFAGRLLDPQSKPLQQSLLPATHQGQRRVAIMQGFWGPGFGIGSVELGSLARMRSHASDSSGKEYRTNPIAAEGCEYFTCMEGD